MNEYFKYVSNALDRDNCEYLTQVIKECKENGTGQIDDQCPTSWSVTKNPILDKVLEEFLPRMELETGKKLFPTYAYARYYEEGEILEAHHDRPSCEYSMTVTLGNDGTVWPFYASDPGDETDQGVIGYDNKIFRVKNVQSIEMEIGDAVVYKGFETPHWREQLEGNWQTQLFLHYVDQDGPYSEWKYDKRPCLEHHDQETDQSIACEDDVEILYWYSESAIADVACDQMISKFESFETEKAGIGGGTSGTVDTEVRDVNKIPITNEIGIGATLTGIGLNMNNRAWKFDVTHSNQTEYLRYDADGHYKTHVDTLNSPNQKETRKITVLAFLNDDFEGGRLYLENGSERVYPHQNKGAVIAFPSYINHGVEPVTKGIRRSIVTWMVGPWFK